MRKKMKTASATAISICFALFLGACSSTDQPLGSRWLTNPVVYGQGDNQNVNDAKAGIVEIWFYRKEQDASSRKPINVYVNHSYLTSLLPGGYAKARVCAGDLIFSAAEDDASNHHLTRSISDKPVTLEVGEVHYYAVQDTEKSKPSIIGSDADKAKEAGLKLQRHTIPRLPVNCDSRSVIPTPIVDATAQPISIPASASIR
jgi:hypothetical protein